jgi:hypothetical protein
MCIYAVHLPLMMRIITLYLWTYFNMEFANSNANTNIPKSYEYVFMPTPTLFNNNGMKMKSTLSSLSLRQD